jgi:hypothetical protein
VIYTDLNPMDPMGRLSQVYPHIVGLEAKRLGTGGEELPQVEEVQRQNMAQLFGQFFTQQTGETLTEEEETWIAALLQEEDER